MPEAKELLAGHVILQSHLLTPEFPGACLAGLQMLWREVPERFCTLSTSNSPFIRQLLCHAGCLQSGCIIGTHSLRTSHSISRDRAAFTSVIKLGQRGGCRWSGEISGVLAGATKGSSRTLLRLARCDTSSAEEAAAVLKPSKGLPELTGLLNCGGVLADAVLSSQSAGKSVHEASLMLDPSYCHVLCL